MDIPDLPQPLPKSAAAHKVMVPRGDEHRDLHLFQRRGERVHGLPGGLRHIRHISGKQHKLRPLALGEGTQLLRQGAHLLPPQPGLVRRQAPQGGVQVEIRRVQQTYHKILKASTWVHAPLSLSMVKRAPSSFPGPFACS